VVSGGEGSRLFVEDAEGAGFEAVHVEGASGVETDFGISDYDGIVGEASVFEGVFDVEDVVEEDGVRAEGDVAGRLADGEALNGLEPLPLAVDHADGDIGDVEDAAGKASEAIEAFLAGSIENVEGVKGGNSVSFVVGDGWCLHGSAPIWLGIDSASSGRIAQVRFECREVLEADILVSHPNRKDGG